MVLVDAIARLLPERSAASTRACKSFSAELERGLEYPHYTRPAEFRGWRVPRCSSRETTAGSRAGVASRAVCGACRVRNPIDGLGLPHAWTVALDWLITIVGAVAIVLAIKA